MMVYKTAVTHPGQGMTIYTSEKFDEVDRILLEQELKAGATIELWMEEENN